MKTVCIIGASGKLGRYMVQHCLGRGYKVNGVCRESSVGKLAPCKDRITIFPGATNNREVIKKAIADCDGVLTVLVPWGVQQYSTGTAQAVAIIEAYKSVHGFSNIVVCDSTIARSRTESGYELLLKSGERIGVGDWAKIRHKWSHINIFEDNFRLLNQKRYCLDSLFEDTTDVVVRDCRQLVELISERVQDRIVVLSFSRIAFDPNDTHALLHVEAYCGDLCGWGHWYLLSKSSGHWRILERIETWVS